jgi:signal transduction histidine kinase
MNKTPPPGPEPKDTGTASARDTAPDPADAQAARERAARLAMLGELTASIAHEVNQPLAAIATQANACLRWLGRDVPDLRETREGLLRIERAAMRAVDVIRGLVALAKKSRPQLAEIDMNKTVEEVLALARSEMRRHDIRLSSNLCAEIRPVHGDRVQLQQVLLNLIMNSIESLRATLDLPKVLSISSDPLEAGGVLVTVEDTGAGLEPAVGERIFDPLFTTKPDGMGMGLAICRSIIDAHGGRIWAEPRAPHGAVFRFILPPGPKPDGNP